MLKNFITRLAFFSMLLGTFAQEVPGNLYCVAMERNNAHCQAAGLWETIDKAAMEIQQPHYNTIWTVDTKGIEHLFRKHSVDSNKWSNTGFIKSEKITKVETRHKDGTVTRYINVLTGISVRGL
ncbi:uncharacterized protein PpBr36_09897 [Pyricularia pennisetigena]|uniref:uncharacterized protein n=1 Tax=Pyricularia pennisetigena TaxID=1578925 RepID=UPI001150CAEC|nr:uncharacterized protein PpBr36_09897 [Pyricularia pennisetigena]TLS22542.1 hypothetical protein PpBr36_09897 [Pyricularia pennisetigena]